MCGIVGYIGNKNSIPVILDGLNRLEYRGYDSSGIAYISDGKLNVNKFKGRLKVLEDYLADKDVSSTIGIGHTRWATHGMPSDANAHPHTNTLDNIAVVHNGIIENYEEIKAWLDSNEITKYKSDTDTEVIAHLINYYYDGDILDAVFKATEKMEGAYAIGVVVLSEPDRLIAVRKDSPLVVGVTDEANYIASDIPAIMNYTRDVYLLENDEIVELRADGVTIYNKFKEEVKREIFKVTWDVNAAEKGGYEHFTIKEIFEQPKAVSETLKRRLTSDNKLRLEGITLLPEDLKKINKIYLASCGTSYYAGLVGRRFLEKLFKIPVTAEVSSEFRYMEPIIDENTLLICVSQSGETLDTLQSLRMAKEKGARILSIVNVVGSSIARESHDVFYTWAGPEIGVASTKAFTTQLMAFKMLALHLADLKGEVSEEEYDEIISELLEIPMAIELVLNVKEKMQKIASDNFYRENIFFMGRGVDVDIAFESSLKLKELSYINSFAIAAGELKHGTIALIEDETLVIAFATQDRLYEKNLSNIKEVKARGAKVIAIAKEGNTSISKIADEVIYIPNCKDYLTPLLSIIPTQFLAYYVAVARNNDVDKPRNLAKSVTVE